jgi:tetratricopeptide (TPR) repeat protein
MIGEYANAVEAYREVLQVDGRWVAPVLQKLAKVYLQLGQYRQAREAVTVVLVLAPEQGRAYWFRGVAQKALGQEEQAIQDWQEAARRGDREAQAALQARGLTCVD